MLLSNKHYRSIREPNFFIRLKEYTGALNQSDLITLNKTQPWNLKMLCWITLMMCWVGKNRIPYRGMYSNSIKWKLCIKSDDNLLIMSLMLSVDCIGWSLEFTSKLRSYTKSIKNENYVSAVLCYFIKCFSIGKSCCSTSRCEVVILSIVLNSSVSNYLIH